MNRTDSRREHINSLTRQSSASHSDRRRLHKTRMGANTSLDRCSTGPGMGAVPRPISRLNRSPSIEIVADSDLEQPQRTRPPGRRTNKLNGGSLHEKVRIKRQR